MEVLYGLHPVEEAIRSGSRRLDHVSVARDRRDDRLERLIDLSPEGRSPGYPWNRRDQLTRLARTDRPTRGSSPSFASARSSASKTFWPPPNRASHRFFLALDGIEDPHNLGALLRTADGAGVDGVILPERRSAPISATVAKTSAGASEHVQIARITNLVRTLEQMKQKNIWVIGLDERGTPDYTDYDFRSDCVLVLGREGAGLHDLVKKTCDHLLRIPMAGQVSSLNVSVAGAIVMFEAMRQRRTAVAPPAPKKPVKERKGLGS